MEHNGYMANTIILFDHCHEFVPTHWLRVVDYNSLSSGGHIICVDGDVGLPGAEAIGICKCVDLSWWINIDTLVMNEAASADIVRCPQVLEVTFSGKNYRGAIDCICQDRERPPTALPGGTPHDLIVFEDLVDMWLRLW